MLQDFFALSSCPITHAAEKEMEQVRSRTPSSTCLLAIRNMHQHAFTLARKQASTHACTHTHTHTHEGARAHTLIHKHTHTHVHTLKADITGREQRGAGHGVGDGALLLRSLSPLPLFLCRCHPKCSVGVSIASRTSTLNPKS